MTEELRQCVVPLGPVAFPHSDTKRGRNRTGFLFYFEAAIKHCSTHVSYLSPEDKRPPLALKVAEGSHLLTPASVWHCVQNHLAQRILLDKGAKKRDKEGKAIPHLLHLYNCIL